MHHVYILKQIMTQVAASIYSEIDVIWFKIKINPSYSFLSKNTQ